MIVDQFGRPIEERRLQPPPPGASVIFDPRSDREGLNVSRRLTPWSVDRIMIAANGGDTLDQCRLAKELPELDETIQADLGTRRRAVSGCKWSIQPADDSPEARTVCDALKTEIDRAGGGRAPDGTKILSFRQALYSLTDAFLPGFSAVEILWQPGGRGFRGFKAVEQQYFSFTSSFAPRIRTLGDYNGVELPAAKIIFHQLAINSGDPCRGGLIRPLAWLHCFKHINVKDLLSFIERFGMPFILAQADEATWQKERTVLQQLISAFGPSGGGIFSKNIELKLLEHSGTGYEVYFKLLEYIDRGIDKVLLGQTATSNDAQGLSNGGAQSQVRQDLLDADARELEETINCDLFAPWVSFNYPGYPVPKLVIASEAAEDTASLATTVKTLFEAGFEADEEEMSERFGMKLKRKPDAAATPVMAAPTAPLLPASVELAEPATPQIVVKQPEGALETWLNPMCDALELAAKSEDPKAFQRALADILQHPKFGSSAQFEQTLSNLIVKTKGQAADAARKQLGV